MQAGRNIISEDTCFYVSVFHRGFITVNGIMESEAKCSPQEPLKFFCSQNNSDR